MTPVWFYSFSNLFASDKNKGASSASSGMAAGAQSEKEPQTKASLHNIQLRDGISERKAKERRDQLKKVKGIASLKNSQKESLLMSYGLIVRPILRVNLIFKLT